MTKRNKRPVRMQRARLLKLAALLERDARNKRGVRFNMAKWGQVDDTNDHLSCGTEACALGLAALSGEFSRAGLGCNIELWGGIDIWRKTPRGLRHGALEAGRAVFGLSCRQAYFLFMPGAYLLRARHSIETCGAAVERRVARRVRALAEGRVRIRPGAPLDDFNELCRRY